MIIMKFGGTSVANCEAITRAISIIKDRLDRHPIVVVSALSGVTDLLYKISDAAAKGNKALSSELVGNLRERHLDLAKGLVSDPERLSEVLAAVNTTCDSLSSFVDAVCAVGELTERSKAKIISNGEWLSSTVIYYAMNDRGIRTGFADARDMIITRGSHMKGEPVISEIEQLVPTVISDAIEGKDTVITQGFISSTTSDEPSTLGRGGSDYTASLIGMALNAKAIEIWTDVDGVRSADPRRVTNTRRIDRISFEEAAEMAHSGAKVLHPLTIEPAVAKNIPVYVLNSMNPTDPGTVILQGDQIPDGAKSVSFKEKVLMLKIFSTKMINVSGFLSRVFDIFAKNNVSVDLISTSEASISLTLDPAQDVNSVVRQLADFAEVHIVDDKSQVSIIGKNVVNQRGLLRWSMAALNNANIYMITHDASSVNISYIIDRDCLDEVLLELHQYLFEF